MKKFLVVLLACAMIFGFASTAFAADEQMAEFNDIQDQSQAAINAIMKLAVLGVLEGNEGIGGAYRPADTITRAEFAKMICYLTGNVKLADGLKNVATKFPDAPAGQWYTGYVNAAVSAGYFKGDTVGNFRPNADITQNELVTVCLRAAGYNDRLGALNNPNVTAAWPGNYVKKATDIEILDNVSFVGSTAATRAEAAIICDAVLDINMVAHIANDLAYSIGLADATVDPDGFTEVYYFSNETVKTKNYETILHKAFGCLSASRALFDLSDNYDEVTAWDYIDFSDGELIAYFANRSAIEVASTYYINKGFTFTDLAGMEAKIVWHEDNDELMFVNVRGSYLLAKTTYLDGGRIIADGKSYRTDSSLYKDGIIGTYTEEDEDGVSHTYFTLPKNSKSGVYEPTGGLNASNKNDDIPVKIYLDKDGIAFAAKDYSAYKGEDFGIFEEMDGKKAEYKNLVGKDLKIDTDINHVILKGKEFVSAEDLEENDVIHYLGQQSGSVQVFLATSPLEGEMTKHNANNGVISVAGYGYGTVGKNDTQIGKFQLSDNGGESFSAFDTKDTSSVIDKSMFTTVAYMPAYNFATLAYVSSIEEVVRIIGVVTDVADEPYYDSDAAKYVQRYTKVTIINAEGKEVTYTFAKDFRDAYNNTKNGGFGFIKDDDQKMSDYYNTEKIKHGLNALKAGDLVSLELDKSDQVKSLDNYIKLASSAEFDVKPNAAKTAVTADGVRQNVNSDAIVFNVSVKKDSGKYASTTVMTATQLMATDHKATQFAVAEAKDKSLVDATVLYMVGNTSVEKMGFVSDFYGTGSGYRIVLNGGEDAKGKEIPEARRGLYIYKVVDGEIGVTTTLATSGGYDLVTTNSYATAIFGSKAGAIVGTVSDVTKDTITIGGKNYYITSDTFAFDYVGYTDKNGVKYNNYIVEDLRDLANRQVLVVFDSNEALYVVVVEGTPDLVALGTLRAAAETLLDEEGIGAGTTLSFTWADFDTFLGGDDVVTAFTDLIETTIDDASIEVTVEDNGDGTLTVILELDEETVEFTFTVAVADPLFLDEYYSDNDGNDTPLVVSKDVNNSILDASDALAELPADGFAKFEDDSYLAITITWDWASGVNYDNETDGSYATVGTVTGADGFTDTINGEIIVSGN